MLIYHTSADHTYYDQDAKYYDSFDQSIIQCINKRLISILPQYICHTKAKILDFACGTGAQVLVLSEMGYDIVGYDISKAMLNIARQKSSNLSFIEGDMRYTNVGKHDLVVTVCNAIGHLTKDDFQLALSNIKHNLHPNAIYIFDIFNADYIKDADNITDFTLDRVTHSQTSIDRQLQFSYMNHDNVLITHHMSFSQCKRKHNGMRNDPQSPHMHNTISTLQCYTLEELYSILHAAGFEILQIISVIDGCEFSAQYTDRMMIVSRVI